MPWMRFVTTRLKAGSQRGMSERLGSTAIARKSNGRPGFGQAYAPFCRPKIVSFSGPFAVTSFWRFAVDFGVWRVLAWRRGRRAARRRQMAVHRSFKEERVKLIRPAAALACLVLWAAPAASATTPHPRLRAHDASWATGQSLGPNVIVFDPSMPQSTIQSELNAIATQQVPNQFGSQ